MKYFFAIILSLIILSTASLIYPMMSPAYECPGSQVTQYHEASLLGILGNPDSPARAALLPFLSVEYIVHLCETCHALQSVWDHDHTIFVKGAERISPLVAFVQRMQAKNPIELNLGDLYQKNMPENIKNLQQLKTLNLRYTRDLRQRTLADIFTWLPQLQVLSFQFCGLQKIPKGLKNLQQLKTLNFTNIYLSRQVLTDIFTGVPQLQVLDLSGSYLETIQDIKHLQQLKTLILRSTDLGCGDPFFHLQYIFARLLQLQEIDLRDRGMKGLPEEILNLKNLKVLYLDGNEISKEIQDRIRQLLPNTKITF